MAGEVGGQQKTQAKLAEEKTSNQERENMEQKATGSRQATTATAPQTATSLLKAKVEEMMKQKPEPTEEEIAANRAAFVDKQIEASVTAAATSSPSSVVAVNQAANAAHTAIAAEAARLNMAINNGVDITQPQSVTKPKPLSDKHVIFASSRPNFGASTPTGILRFTGGFAQTADEEQIKYLEENAEHFGIKKAA